MNERVQQILEQIISAPLSSLQLPVFLGAGRPSDKWSFLNKLSMLASGTEDARGFRQWKEAGRWVKAGAHAIWILGPVTRKWTEKVEREDGRTEEVEHVKLYGFKPIPVFRVEDTEGKPMPEEHFNYTIPVEMTPVLTELGLEVRAEAWRGAMYGCYSRDHVIRVMTPDLQTLLHELCHAVDDKLHNLEGDRAEKEFVAELGGAIIASLMGYDYSQSSVRSYLVSYGFTDLMQSAELLNRTMKVVDWVVQRTAKQTVEITA